MLDNKIRLYDTHYFLDVHYKAIVDSLDNKIDKIYKKFYFCKNLEYKKILQKKWI